jgi:hypothetical protein
MEIGSHPGARPLDRYLLDVYVFMSDSGCGSSGQIDVHGSKDIASAEGRRRATAA